MNITLQANPSDAPGCVKIEAEDGRTKLFQRDYEFPLLATNYGWTTIHAAGESTLDFVKGANEPCPGSMFTDGTIDCPTCNKSSSSFIHEARQHLDNHDGEVVPDGMDYFTDDACTCSGDGCNQEVKPGDRYYATPCGTYCDECMEKHINECEVCRNEFR